MTMNCEAIRTLLEEQPLAEFSPAEREAAKSHTAGCPACAQLLAAERALQTELNKLPEPQQPMDLTGAVMTRIAQLENSKAVNTDREPELQNGEWPMWLITTGIAVTFCFYARELFNGRSTAFDLLAPWKDGWQQSLFVVPQPDLLWLVLAAGIISYLAGLLVMLRGRGFHTARNGPAV